ncbi:hypothetical protein F511_28875 [Dorcoceras hygrometricum]|uniref:Uncharacterized protein n=1 Tax=Dorcoceras hygrometricum TaxID=472368 RepID=A0A2Z7BA04_9LAMI|nr:hypothetical protein F511_28875 [Dorcoceras hygrometricum]
MIVDLIGIYVLKGPYCTLTMTDWFLQALSVIPRGSWGDVARRFTMIRWASPKLWFQSHTCCGPMASCIPEPLRVTQDVRSVLYEKELEQFFDTALVKDNEILCVIHGKLVDAVSHERFGLMTAIHFELKVNWSKLLFDILKEMADKSSKRAKGYAAQICFLLKGDPAVTLEEAKIFPPLKILSAKTVGTYVATNKTIDARDESDEPEVAKVTVVKRKSVSKKRSASTANKETDEVQVEIVAEKAVSKKRPAASSDAPAVKKKRTATKRVAPAEKDLALVTVAQDAVPIQIIEPISAVPAERPHAQKRKAPKRKLRLSTDTVKGHPAREMFQLICGDIEFLVQLREKVIDDVAKFFNSFSLRRLAVMKSVKDIAAKEEQVLTWAKTDSVQVALQRRLYIDAKYRELLLRKFLEAHRANFSFSQPWSSMVLQIIDLLSAAHSTSVKNLLTQKQAL